MRSLLPIMSLLVALPAVAAPGLGPGQEAPGREPEVSRPPAIPPPGCASGNCQASVPPRWVGGETIIIHDHPPKVLPHPRKNYHRMAPPYSDEAIDRDVWARAWVLLDIDTRGQVARVKLLNPPGYGLDKIAVDHAFKLRFDPAQDEQGHAVGSMLVWTIEWPSYWWLVDSDQPPNRVPDNADLIPCKGTGPLNLSRLHPTQRDCTPPDMHKIETAAWLTRK
jgi:hypothetical protein